MRYAITLAAIPLPLLMWTAWPASQPIAAKAVQTEGVRAQRQDAGTFRLRWSVVSDLPPALVIHEVPAEATASVALPPVRLVRRAALRQHNNVCARHGMRRVTYTRGRWQGWRCRR
jgi:hypothetical protein